MRWRGTLACVFDPRRMTLELDLGATVEAKELCSKRNSSVFPVANAYRRTIRQGQGSMNSSIERMGYHHQSEIYDRATDRRVARQAGD
jgi:hypothetical protein